MSMDPNPSLSHTFGAFIDQRYEPWAREHLHDEDAAQLKQDFADWLSEPLTMLNAWRIESWRQGRLEESVQPVMVNRQLRALGECLRKAVEWRVIERNPLQDLRLDTDAKYLIELFAGGIGHSYLGEGWARAGVHYTCTLGTRAFIELPPVKTAIDYVLTLHVPGIFAPVRALHQRVTVSVNGTQVGQVLCRGADTFDFFVPAAALGHDRLTIVMELPDARRPMDYKKDNPDRRFLALRVAKIEFRPLGRLQLDAAPPVQEPEAPMSVLDQRAALLDMASLGFNCEFGFVQRWLGAEPMSLFRWTSAPLAKLIVALDKKFAGLDSRDVLDLEVTDTGEYVTEDRLYGFRHHTFVFENEGVTRERVKRNEFLRIGVLSKTLLEELHGQRKLFVYHDMDESSLDQVRELVRALRAYGANTLLWIVSAADETQSGTARQLEPGLIQGYVSGFQRGTVYPVSPYMDSWVKVAGNAHKAWCATRS